MSTHADGKTPATSRGRTPGSTSRRSMIVCKACSSRPAIRPSG